MIPVLATYSDFLNGWLVATGFLFFIFLGFLSGTIRAIQSRSWPQVKGTVLESVVKERSQPSASGSSRRDISYEPTVRYSYAVDDKPHESKQIATGVVIGSREAAETVCGKYPTNSEVTVFHHPRRHYLAFLEPGRFGLPLMATLLAGCAVCFIGGVWITKSLHSGVRNQQIVAPQSPTQIPG
ncbi:MAG: hypothetical protein JWL59_3322 [Chthoniobacteraceae bacterium]|nr:hypothetical protein [Chthoniobacteraceae bacterium]